jgi:hypothetical protein
MFVLGLWADRPGTDSTCVQRLTRQFGPSVRRELRQPQQLTDRRIGLDLRNRGLLPMSRIVAPVVQDVKGRHELALYRRSRLARDEFRNARATASGFVGLQYLRLVAALRDRCREQDRLRGGARYGACRKVVSVAIGTDRFDRALSEPRTECWYEAGKDFGHPAHI